MFAHLQYLDELSRQKMPATGVARECVCGGGGGGGGGGGEQLLSMKAYCKTIHLQSWRAVPPPHPAPLLQTPIMAN